MTKNERIAALEAEVEALRGAVEGLQAAVWALQARPAPVVAPYTTGDWRLQTWPQWPTVTYACNTSAASAA